VTSVHSAAQAVPAPDQAPRRGHRFRSDPNRRWALGFGGLFLAGGVANLMLVLLVPHAYDNFADASYWPFVTHAWHSVVVPNVQSLITLLAVFELTTGVLILGRRHRCLGMAAAATFSVALTLFGWGFFFWSVPTLALLGRFAIRERHPPVDVDPI